MAKAKKSNEAGESTDSSTEQSTAANESTGERVVAPAENAAQAGASQQTEAEVREGLGQFIGDRDAKVYHRPTADCVKKTEDGAVDMGRRQMAFENEGIAVHAKYKACEVCLPVEENQATA